MLYSFKVLLFSITISSMLTIGLTHAQQSEEETVDIKIPENSVLSDGVIDKKEMAKYLVIANKQLAYLAERATTEYQARIGRSDSPMPSGWMLMKDGVTVKELKLDESAKGAPPHIRVVMFRAALKSIARRGQINAAAVLYAGQLSDENPQKVLVLEHEHRLGISGNKFIPYKVSGEKIVYSEAITKEKPFQIFYDSKANAPGASD
jgi:hypothetical protein